MRQLWNIYDGILWASKKKTFGVTKLTNFGSWAHSSLEGSTRTFSAAMDIQRWAPVPPGRVWNTPQQGHQLASQSTTTDVKYSSRPAVRVRTTPHGGCPLRQALCKSLHMYYVPNLHSDPVKSILSVSAPLSRVGNRLNEFYNLPKVTYPARGREGSPNRAVEPWSPTSSPPWCTSRQDKGWRMMKEELCHHQCVTYTSRVLVFKALSYALFYPQKVSVTLLSGMVGQVLFAPLCRWVSWGPERLNNQVKVT